MEAEALTLGGIGIAAGWLLYATLAHALQPSGTELDLPGHRAAQSAFALPALTWLPLKCAAQSLSQMNLTAELKHE